MHMRTRLLLAVLFAASHAAADPSACLNTDELTLGVGPTPGTVRLTHLAAMYNCCPEPILYDVGLQEGVLTVTERVLEESPCDCVCCFDLEVVVTDVPPGDWAVVLRWFDAESGAWSELTGAVTVPVSPARVMPRAELAVEPVCLNTTGIEPNFETSAWGAVKSAYR